MNKVVKLIVTGLVFSVVTSISMAAPSVATSSAVKSVNQTTQPTAAPANGMLTAKHPIYTLRLNSNPTTGFSWFVVSYPEHLVKIIKHEYLPPQTQRIGAGGVEVWQFQATKAALAVPTVIKVTLMYARPWEINDQSTVQSFYMVTN